MGKEMKKSVKQMKQTGTEGVLDLSWLSVGDSLGIVQAIKIWPNLHMVYA